jgi:hypothetical protein
VERKIKTGQRESNCLELVRKAIFFTHNGEPVRNFWNNKSYLGIWRGNPRPFNDRDESAACFFKA